MLPEELRPALDRCAIFSGVTEALRYMRISECAAGEIVVERGSSFAGLGVVLGGSLRVSRQDGQRTVVLNFLREGDCFGVSSMFSSSPGGFPTCIEAKSDACVALIDEADVKALILSSEVFALRYIDFLTGRIRFLNTRITDFTAGSASERLAGELIRRSTGCSVDIESYSALAKSLDIGRASLYRALDELAAAGEITREGRKITINDIDALKMRVDI